MFPSHDQGGTFGDRRFSIGISSASVTQASYANYASNTYASSSSGTYYLCGASSTSSGYKSLLLNSNVYITGGNTVNATNFDTPSDRRLKDNIEDVGKNQVKKLVEEVEVKTFSYKADPDKTLLGMIAQDIEKQNTVIGNLLFNKNEKGFLSVHESKLVYVLWNYVQQLSKRVSDLEDQLDKRS